MVETGLYHGEKYQPKCRSWFVRLTCLLGDEQEGGVGKDQQECNAGSEERYVRASVHQGGTGDLAKANLGYKQAAIGPQEIRCGLYLLRKHRNHCRSAS